MDVRLMSRVENWVDLLGDMVSYGKHLFTLKNFFILIQEKKIFFIACRERGRQRGREKEKQQSVAFCTRLDWGSDPPPKYVPWPGIKPTMLQLQDNAPTNGATLARAASVHPYKTLANCFPKWWTTLHPYQKCMSSTYFIFLTALGLTGFLMLAILMVSYCGLNLHLPNDYRCWISFMCTVAVHISSLLKV